MIVQSILQALARIEVNSRRAFDGVPLRLISTNRATSVNSVSSRLLAEAIGATQV
jgi:hypothetical protein